MCMWVGLATGPWEGLANDILWYNEGLFALQMLNPEVGPPRFKNKLFKNACKVKFDIGLIL